MPSTIRQLRVLLPALTGLAAVACGGGDVVLPGEGVAANITLVSGNNQAGVVGATLVDSLLVRVTDSKNRPVQNQQVTFSPGNAASGQAVPPTVTTNADGRTGVKWVLGTVAGSQSMIAKPTGNGAPASLSVFFTATASSAIPSKLVKSAGDGQNGAAGAPVAVPPAVKVTDADGNPVAGVGVTFAVASGGGTVNPTTPIATDANGVAAVTSWTLGAVAGPNTLTATAAGAGITGNPATFTATGRVGAASKLGLAVAPSASAASGAPIAVQPQIQIQDAAGNGVASANVAISVNISSGGGSLSGGPTVVQTNAGGLATFAGLTITGPVGPYTLLFTASGLTSVSAPVTLGAGNPSGSQSSFSISPASFVAGTPSGSTVTVTARDAGGNLIAGAAVAVNVTGTNTVTPTPLALTDAGGATSGVITSDQAGVKTVTVTINGVAVTNPASATLTVLPGLPSIAISTVSASPTTLLAGNGTSATITVTVKDLFGNPIPGESVTLASTGATITQPAAVTNASGVTTGSVSYATAGAKIVSATVLPSTSITQTAGITVDPAPTTTTNGAPANATSGVPFSVPASVAPNPPSGGTPTGTITVTNNVTGDQCTITLPAPSCNLTLNTTGTVTVTATYSGDANYLTSQKGVSVSVSGAPTTTGVGSSDANSVFGEAVTFTATVSPGTATGTVTFKDGGTCASGGTVLDTETLSSGTATSVAISTLSVGSHTIWACYGGGGAFSASGGSTTQNVGQAATTTGVGSSANPSVVGQSVTFTATVTVNGPGTGTPTGTVQFQSDGSNIGGAVALSGGVATRSTSGLAVGSHTITATYNGSGNFQGSTGTLAPDQTVNQGATTTTITSVLPASPSTTADALTVSYNVDPVAPAAGNLGNGGATVTVSLDAGGGGESCVGSVTAGGAGSCVIPAPINAGSPRSVTAVYSGNANFTGSTSASVDQTVTP
jgi:hypothetical protein